MRALLTRSFPEILNAMDILDVLESAKYSPEAERKDLAQMLRQIFLKEGRVVPEKLLAEALDLHEVMIGRATPEMEPAPKAPPVSPSLMPPATDHQARKELERLRQEIASMKAEKRTARPKDLAQSTSPDLGFLGVVFFILGMMVVTGLIFAVAQGPSSNQQTQHQRSQSPASTQHK